MHSARLSALPIPFGEKHGSTISEMQFGRPAVSTMNGARRNITRATANHLVRFRPPVLEIGWIALR
jgi:hypothetical protein